MKKNQNYKSLKVFKNKHTKNQDDFSMLNRQYIEELFDGKKVLEEEVSTIKHSNPNILINGNFQVNQRNSTSYTSSSSEINYTVDRWCFSKMANSTCKVDTNKITLKSSGTTREDFFMQYVANPNFYSSKTLTLSVKYQNLTGKFAIGIWDGSSMTKTPLTTEKTGTLVVTKTIQSACTSISCEFLKELSTTVSVEILSAKLEVGTTPTTFIQRTYDEDFDLCKKYFLKIKASSTYSILASGLTLSTSKSFFLINNKMRAAPTVTASGNITVLIGTSYKTISSIYQDGYCDGGILLCCSGTNFVAGQPALLSTVKDATAYIDFDAEIR